MRTREALLALYAVVLTVAFGALLFLSARRQDNGAFDQITVHRINVVEPDGTPRLVISNKASFPGSFFNGKEYPRTDRSSTGMIFADDEGTENGGLIFGGSKGDKGTGSSYGHLSFDNYQRDQTMVLESDNDGPERHIYFGLNDDDSAAPITPEMSAEWQKVKALPQGPERDAATKAFKARYSLHLVQRGYFGRDVDRSVALVLKDTQGHARLTARVAPDGTPQIQFLDSNGKVLRTLGVQ